LATQLQNALNSRIILEQAKGVLAERSKTDCVSAFGELRQMARRAQLPIHQVASEIIANVGVQQQIRAEALSASVA
jgi:AmiR/NasT family two-component response regulator